MQQTKSNAQNVLPISNAMSLFGSNLAKSGDLLSNNKNAQAFLTLYYLLTKYKQGNSTSTKDDNTQHDQNTPEDSKNPLDIFQQGALIRSQSQDKQSFTEFLQLQLKNSIDHKDGQNNANRSKSKSSKKVKKVKEPKTPKKHYDVNRTKFTRSKSQPTSTFFNRSEYLFSLQKKICIPDWKYIRNEDNMADTTNINCKDDNSPDDTLDIKMHERLEIYENRIANGLTKYHHPAYSVQLEADEASKEILPTEIEKQKLANYESIIPQQHIPLFWEPRSWDTEESRMTNDDSDKLQHRIEQEESDESIFNLIRSSSKYKLSKKYYSYSSSSSSSQSSSSQSPLDSPYNSNYSLGLSKRKKRESNISNKERRHFGTLSNISYSRKSTEVEISNLYYETDESCDETDIELF